MKTVVKQEKMFSKKEVMIMDHKNGEGYRDPTAEYAINGVRREELQRLREKEYGIKRGEVITLKYTENEDEREQTKIRTRKMKVIGFYKHFVLLESPKGIRESMSYWKLNRCMSESGGGPIET